MRVGAGLPRPYRTGGLRRGGYTLIELAMVVVVVGIMALLIVPKFRIGADLNASSRRLSGMIRFLGRESLARRQALRLALNLDDGTVTAEGLQDDGAWLALDPLLAEKETLPKGQSFRDVETLRQGKVASGRAFIFFSPEGRTDPVVIHLSAGNAVTTLMVNPLTGRVAIRDGELNGEDFDLPKPRGT